MVTNYKSIFGVGEFDFESVICVDLKDFSRKLAKITKKIPVFLENFVEETYSAIDKKDNHIA